MIGVGRNYAEHAAEHGNEVPKEPLIFIKPSTSVIGPNDAIRLPLQSKQVEHEAELAVVIGATGARRVDRAGAERAIFGYTCANDVTARDLQRSDGAVDPGQGLRLVLPDRARGSTPELDVSDLEVRCEVGRDPDEMEVRQLGRTKDMVFDVPTLVSYVSHVMTLLPGDVILTGTPAGVSPIVAGDTVTVRIEGIGELRTRSSPGLIRPITCTRCGGSCPGRRRNRRCGNPILRAPWARVEFVPARQGANGVWGNWQPN